MKSYEIMLIFVFVGLVSCNRVMVSKVLEGGDLGDDLDPPETTDEEAAADAKRMAGTGIVITHKTPRYLCPPQCHDCCKHYHFQFGFGIQNQDGNKFKCHMPAADVATFNVPHCSKAKLRKSDKSQGQSTCKLTGSEIALNMSAQLQECTDGPIEQSYEDFLGAKRWKDYCSISYTGTMLGLEAIGAVIDSRYFSVSSDILSGGVCNSLVPDLAGGGLLDKLCATEGLPLKECGEAEKVHLCKGLQDDMDGGRIDKASLAFWGAAMGPLATMAEFPKPIGNRRLKKFKIGGWKARSVAFEAPSWDKQIDLGGGGFQCMITKIKSLPVDDDFLKSGRNQFVKTSGSGTAEQDSTDTLLAYFTRYQLYPKPNHFVVPADELQTDLTLEKLVFQSIGAHRVEPIGKDGRTINLNPIGIHGLPTAAMVGSPGLLETLPSELQTKAAYIVRMEGLFDQIPLREGMQVWGGNAFFSKQGKLLALQYRGETIVKGQDDKKWAVFKFIFRSSLIGTITVFDHLISTHILASEAFAIASIETLPDTHGLRLLLTPHVWGTLKVNFDAANNLFAKSMLVHRTVPFGDEAFIADDGGDGKLWQMIPSLRYTKFLDTYAAYTSSLDTALLTPSSEEIPFFADGKLFYDTLHEYMEHAVYIIYNPQTHKLTPGSALLPKLEKKPSTKEGCSLNLQADERAHKFVKTFFDQNADTPDFWPADYRDAASDCDKLVNFMTEVVFLVTGWHRHVGSVADFFRDTRFAATAWKEGETQSRPKQSMLTQLLAATTNAINPKLTQSLTSIYSNDYIFREVFNHLHESMNNVQAEVERRNLEREKLGRLGFHQMEPQFLEWGVQV